MNNKSEIFAIKNKSNQSFHQVNITTNKDVESPYELTDEMLKLILEAFVECHVEEEFGVDNDIEINTVTKDTIKDYIKL